MSADERADCTPRGRGPQLEVFRLRLAISRDQLWADYMGMGGEATPTQVADYLDGTAEISRHDHNMVALALNEVYLDRGGDYPVPYMDDDPTS